MAALAKWASVADPLGRCSELRREPHAREQQQPAAFTPWAIPRRLSRAPANVTWEEQRGKLKRPWTATASSDFRGRVCINDTQMVQQYGKKIAKGVGGLPYEEAVVLGHLPQVLRSQPILRRLPLHPRHPLPLSRPIAGLGVMWAATEGPHSLHGRGQIRPTIRPFPARGAKYP